MTLRRKATTFFYKDEKFKCRNPKCGHIKVLKRGTRVAPRCPKCKGIVDLKVWI